MMTTIYEAPLTDLMEWTKLQQVEALEWCTLESVLVSMGGAA